MFRLFVCVPSKLIAFYDPSLHILVLLLYSRKNFFFWPSSSFFSYLECEKKQILKKKCDKQDCQCQKKEAQHTSIQVKWWLQNVNKLLTWQQTKSELFKNVIHIRILPLTYSVHGKNRTLFIRCHNSQKLTQDHPQEKNLQIEY